LFGFNKKKPEVTLINFVAAKTQHILNAALEEELKTLQDKIEDRFNVSHKNTAAGLYFAECMQYDLLTMAYQFGFIEGMSQAYGISEKALDVLCAYGLAEEQTIKNYYSILELKNNPKSYLELWSDAFQKKLFETDEDAAGEMLTGMAEGKSYGDVIRTANEDYSILKDPSAISSLNIDGFRKLFRQWSFYVLHDKEMQNLLRTC
jgi:hypothetical protein